MNKYTEEQLIDMYSERRYKRWMKQRIKLRLSLLLNILLLGVSIVLAFLLFFPLQGSEQQQDSDVRQDSEQSNTTLNEMPSIPGRYVFLTFDDGPSPYTQQILDILNDRNATGIFFVIGDRINIQQDAVEQLNRILEEGHYIGLHSMTHEPSILYHGEGAPDRFVNEMLELNQLISEITGGFSTNLCRAPFGMVGTFTSEHHVAVSQANLRCIDWNIDSNDWEIRHAERIHENVMSQVELLNFPDELVILFHEFSWTVEALPGIIDDLRANGYTIATYVPEHIFLYYRFR